jgi:hypothetical protein
MSYTMPNKVLPSKKVPQPQSEIVSRPVTGTQPINKSPGPCLGPLTVGDPRSNNDEPPADHISPPIRADLSKLTPELAAGVRRVANTK